MLNILFIEVVIPGLTWLQLETIGFVMANLATMTASGSKPLIILSLLPRSVMNLESSSAEFTLLLLLLLDPKLLRVDLWTMWFNVTRGATMVAGRQAS
jgi:hypothetical protein